MWPLVVVLIGILDRITRVSWVSVGWARHSISFIVFKLGLKD